MIQIDNRSSKPLYEQIIEQIKLHVIRGQLNPGDPIPSVRRLALTLSVTPSTVAKAYQELERQKVIETIRAKGTFIAAGSTIKMDEDKVRHVESSLQSGIMELKLMGYSKDQVLALVTELYEGLGEDA